ncbi:hypothetical protein PG987_013742 [Apiospora arundinis]
MDPGPIHRRRRPAIACTECRRRKVSCDLASPCGPCRKSRYSLRCVYNNNNNGSSSNSRKTKTRNANTESLSNISNKANSRRAHAQGRRSTSDFSSRQGSEGTPETSASGSSAAYKSLPESDKFHGSAPKIADLDQDLLELGSSALGMDFFSGLDFLNIDQLGYHEPPPHSKPSLILPEGPWCVSKAVDFPSMFHCSQINFDLGHYWDIQPSAAAQLADRTAVIQPPASEWLDLGVGREVVLHLLRKYTRAAVPNAEVAALPGDEMARPLMEILAKLEQTAVLEHEKKAMVAPSVWSGPSSPNLTVTAAKKLLPSRLECDDLVKTFINTFESVFSVLHVPSFLLEYERLWEASSTSARLGVDTVAEETFICNLLLIITLGSYASLHRLASTYEQTTLQSQAACWVAFVKHWTTQQMVTGYRASIGTAQTMCLMALTKLICPQHSGAAGTNILLGDYDLTRIGFQIGLHRKPTVNMSRKVAEMHRGLWATMLELSLQQCFDKGLPASLTHASYDCEPPSGNIGEEVEDDNDEDQDYHNEEHLLPRSPGNGKFTIIGMLAATQRLRIQVLDVLNAPSRSQAYDSSHQLAAELNEVCNTNMAKLGRTPASSTRDFQIHMLEMSTRPFVIALHCPFADQVSPANPTYYYSRIMRMELSALLLTSSCSPESVHDKDSSSGSGGSATPPSTCSSYWRSSPDFLANQRSQYYQTSHYANAAGPTSSDLMMHNKIDSIDFGGTLNKHIKTNGDDSIRAKTNADQRAEASAVIAAASSASSETLPPEVYASLLFHGHGFYAHARRNATTSLFLDLISELEEQSFPTLHGATWQLLREVLHNVVQVFEKCVIYAGGIHSTREFVLFSAAAAYVDGLLRREQRGAIGSVGRVGIIDIGGVGVTTFDTHGKAEGSDNVDGFVAGAATKALALCAKIVGQKSLSSLSPSAQSASLSQTGL